MSSELAERDSNLNKIKIITFGKTWKFENRARRNVFFFE
jgi:hypothetical protein